MTYVDIIPLVIVGALAGAEFILRNVSKSAQDYRLTLAEKGERLLAREDLPLELRAEVERWLDDPFPCSCWLGVLLLPFIPFFVWISLAQNRGKASFDALRQTSPDIRGSYLELRAIIRKLQLANHPIMTPLGEFVVNLSLVMAIPVLLIVHRSPANSFDRDNSAVSVEEFWSHVPKLARS
ncbi:hypothetical protein ACETK8_06320 [Brevundimonas staleyi]|uniref:Uncharacterized protein n=1 Tax=Brevundimonas staleyi TaxID=74326 RepID=A0ABW0FMH2_9CAUL